MARRAGVGANQRWASFPFANQRQERAWGWEAGAAVRLKSGEQRAAGRLKEARRPAGPWRWSSAPRAGGVSCSGSPPASRPTVSGNGRGGAVLRGGPSSLRAARAGGHGSPWGPGEFGRLGGWVLVLRNLNWARPEPGL